ncbi:MAG: hypothetical protein F4X12_20200 [Acidobacteriia bacterium]|nr:hypothetical protein [Terriglobia bacterium]
MIRAIKPDTRHYDQVVELGDANSKTLGFLPYAAIRDAASKGGVLGYVRNGAVEAYALFARRVRSGHVSLTHLCVGAENRGSGIARALVDTIVERNPNSAGIRLSCRKDYDAHNMWPKLGFEKWGEKPGRSKAGHLLVVWWRPIAARSLFDVQPEVEDDRLVVALDRETLAEISGEEPARESAALMADWVDEFAELVVTEDVASVWEGDGRSEHVAVDLLGYRVLESASQEQTERVHALLSDTLDSQSTSRLLTSISQASEGGASHFLTRDAEVLGHSDTIEGLIGLTVLTPEDFLLRLHTQGDERDFQTRAIAASGLSISSSPTIPTQEDLASLSPPVPDGRIAELGRRLVGTVARDSGRVDEIVADDGPRLALAASYRQDQGVVVAVLRTNPIGDAYSCTRQLSHHLRVRAASQDVAQVRVEDAVEGAAARALADEGFRKHADTWIAEVRTDIYGPEDPLPAELADARPGELAPERVSDYEKYMWPSKVFAGTVPCYVVPIRAEYARVLLGYEELQGRLFEEHESAAMARENVYYRYPRRLETPSRLLWWVSGGGLTGGMRALSWLDAMDSGDPRQLHLKYRHRGVLSEQDVVGRARVYRGSGAQKVTALLFSRTEVFPEPVPLARARELDARMQKAGFFQTVQETDEASVLAFYREATKRDD